ncbi:hypothetical protein Tcan_06092 [Toxocara canis]|uniref:Uncharacterized protein n=1 Tax=Toxocara canis TaxID=6265 RepID=A0A0B2VF56_TOXCA|nr:hypothetical protein Tcan_06092 [Toxocara canis]
MPLQATDDNEQQASADTFIEICIITIITINSLCGSVTTHRVATDIVQTRIQAMTERASSQPVRCSRKWKHAYKGWATGMRTNLHNLICGRILSNRAWTCEKYASK